MSDLRLIGTAGHSMKAVARWKVLGTNVNEALAYVKSPALARKIIDSRAREAVLVETLENVPRWECEGIRKECLGCGIRYPASAPDVPHSSHYLPCWAADIEKALATISEE